MRKTLIFELFLCAYLCFSPIIFSAARGENTAASIVYVGGSGPGNFTKIQDALGNVTEGGTVYVLPGTYHEHLLITVPVHLVGVEKDTTILDGDNQENVVIIAAEGCSVSGLTITDSGKTFPDAGILLTSDRNSISENILTGNYYGMRLESAQYNLISSNEIINNRRCGVYFSRSSHNTLTGNIVSNHSFNGFGLYEFSNNNTILENVLSRNNFSGVNIRDSMCNTVIDNRFIGDHVGIRVPPPEYKTVLQGNVFTENPLNVEEGQDPMVFIGAGFTVFLLVVFLILRKKKT